MSAGGSRSRARTSSVRGRWIFWGAIVVLALFLAFLAWILVRGWLAKDELEAAVPAATEVQRAILAGESDAAIAAAEELAARSEAAAALTSDPVWGFAESIPWVGPNLTTMRVLAASVDRASSGAIVPLARAAGEIDVKAFVPVDGRIDVQPMIDAQAVAAESHRAIVEALTPLSDASVAHAEVVAPLAQARATVTETLTEAEGAIGALDRAVHLVPVMMGADGPRKTLLLIQNNAELRSTGGLPGAASLVTTDAGSFSLAKHVSGASIPRFDPPVVDLPLDTRALWGDNTARYFGDVGFTPQFPLSASIAREMWRAHYGDDVDSVVALDVVALAYLLRATGPVQLPTGDTLSAENAVQLLLSDVYARYPDSVEQDAFFADAADSVFDAVSSGAIEPRALIEAFARAGAERRMLIWNADAAAQEILDGTTLAGDLPEATDNRQPFGVYLNDMTGSKMDTFLSVDVAAGVNTCRQDDLPLYEIDVTLQNNAPADAATRLPPAVIGIGAFDTPPGSMTTSLHVYSVEGTYNLGVLRDGEPVAYHPTSERGYTLSKVVSQLAPGERVTYRFGFLGSNAGERLPVVEGTPTLKSIDVTRLAVACDRDVW